MKSLNNKGKNLIIDLEDTHYSRDYLIELDRKLKQRFHGDKNVQ